MRKRAKVDGNHGEIVEALRKVGFNVLSLAAVGGGCPDLLVSRQPSRCPSITDPRRGCDCAQVFLVEVKRPKGKLTKAQEEFHKHWSVTIIRSVDDVVNL